MRKNYRLLINGTDYTKYLQLPFSISERITDAYDSCSISLDFMKKKTPFEKNSLVEIHILDGVFPRDGECYYFLVASDSVDDTSRKYQHTINLIETTKRADNIFLQPFSITNRSNATWIEQELSEWEGDNVYTDFNPPVKHFVHSIGGYYHTYNIFGFQKAFLGVGGWKKLSAAFRQVIKPKKSLLMKYDSDQKVILPGFSCSLKEIGVPVGWYGGSPKTDYIEGYGYYKFDGWHKPKEGYLKTLSIPGFAKYYIRTKGSTNWTELGVTKIKGSAEDVIVSKAYSFQSENSTISISLPKGEYEMMVKSVQYNETFDTNKELLSVLTSFTDGEEESKIASAIEDNTSSNNLSSNSYITSFSVGKFENVRKTTFKTLREVLDKIISMINPDYGKFTYNISELVLDSPVPDMVFDGIKSLSEILFEIGKTIRSVPVISKDNVISFETYTPDDNASFDLLSERIGVSYDTSSYASSFISSLKNIVNVSNRGNTIYSYYPGRGLWSKGRANNSSSATFNPDNASINIENSKNGIYAVKSIKVKNFWNSAVSTAYSEPEEGLEIIDFCWEKTAYDALYKGCKDENGRVILSNTCAANCFYYEKGTKVINISPLSENEAIAVFGSTNSATYQIQNAIAAAILQTSGFDYAGLAETSGSSRKYSKLKSPEEYEFQVAYIEDYNATIKVQQFDMSSYLEPFDIPYNQNSQTISAYTFGSVTQEEISRRGNNYLNVEKTIYSIDSLPYLGEIHEFEGSLYFADEIQYDFYENHVNCSLNMTKDYNKINSLVGLSREYRQYSIENQEKVDRNIVVYDYCYLNKNDFLEGTSRFPIVNYSSLLRERQQFPSYAVVFFKDRNGDLIKYTGFDPNDPSKRIQKSIHPIIVPVTSSIIGNSLAISFSMADNFSAGSYLGANKTYKDWFGNNVSGARSQEYARYVDDYGEAYQMSVYFIDPKQSLSSYMNSFPYAINSNGKDIEERDMPSLSIWLLRNYPIYKDMNEKISLTYQMHFCTEDRDIKWHQSLIKYLMYDSENPNDIFTDSSGYLNNSLRPSLYGIKKNQFTGEVMLKTESGFLSSTVAAVSSELEEYGKELSYKPTLATAVGNEKIVELKKDMRTVTVYTVDGHFIGESYLPENSSDLVYGNGVFIAYLKDGKEKQTLNLYKSIDGISWKTIQVSDRYFLILKTNIVYGEYSGGFNALIFSEYEENICNLYSKDGITWNILNLGITDDKKIEFKKFYSSDTVVYTQFDYIGDNIVSIDADHNYTVLSKGGSSEYLSGNLQGAFTFKNKEYILVNNVIYNIVGYIATRVSTLSYSNYYIKNSISTENFIIVNSTSDQVLYSKDLINWKDISKEIPFKLNSLSLENEKIYAVGSRKPIEIIASNDGLEWDFTFAGVNDSIEATSTVIPQEDFDGYALVLPKTMEVLFHVELPLKKGEKIELPKITFNYFSEILKS